MQRKDKLTDVERLQQERAVAVAEAVDALAKLHAKEVREKLKAFSNQDRGGDRSVTIRYSDEFLRSNDPSFWFRCFVRLFPRGDCMERSVERPTHVPMQRWVKCLLKRVDFRLWARDVEFVAALYNVMLRRDQMSAVEAGLKEKPLTVSDARAISELTAADLMSAALASGDVNVKQVLRKQGLDVKLRRAFERLQVFQRRVRGSEAARDDIIPKV